MAEAVNNNPQRQERAKQLSRKACAFAEALVKKDIKCETFADVVNHQWLWTEFRVVFKQLMNVWRELTVATLAVDGSGAPAGWQVEKRKETSGPAVLSDDDVEKVARSASQIRPDMKLRGIERRAISNERSFAVACFDGPTASDAFEVAVNHTTGDLVGVLPARKGKTIPIATDDGDAEAAAKLAWKRVQADLSERVGPDVAEQASEVVKLTPQTAVRDELGQRIYRYHVWTFFTICSVTIEEGSREIVAWYVEAFQDDAPECRLAEAAAKETAKSELKAERGLQGPSVTFDQAGEQHKTSVYWWHAEEGVNIEGDQTTVLLNGWNGKIFSVSRKWRNIPPAMLKEPGISADQAMAAADRAVGHDPAAPAGYIIGKSMIQVADNPDEPSPVRDVLVWRVGYSDPKSSGFTEAAIDCRTGQSARVTGW
jgi:hypothetical protein